METGITLERAVALLEEAAVPVGTEILPATEAAGRVLAADVMAPMDQPPWPRSPLDGYALRAEDTAKADRDHPTVLRIVDTVYAGGWSEANVGPGEVVRLMTGAPIPAGCDCVVRQEDTAAPGAGLVQVFTPLQPWENYCFRGEDFRAGEVLLPAGTRLSGAALGVLASAGLLRQDVHLTVRRKVRCALICTGDELVPNGVRPLPPGKIYSANEALLESRLTALGVELTSVRGCFGDDAGALAEVMAAACGENDLVITTGGVSVGERDILHEALPLLGAERLFWQVEMKPGSPVMLSRLRGVPILSLSGNPFAAAATFELLARPLLAALAGAEDLKMNTCTAILDTPFSKGGRRFLRGFFRDGRVRLPEGHSSGQLRSSVGANCLVELDGPRSAGSEVKVYLL